MEHKRKPPPSPLYTFRGNMASIHCFFLDVNEQEHLYVGTDVGHIHIWDLKICRELKSVKVHDGSCLAIKKLDSYLVTQEKGECIKFWTVTDLNFDLVKKLDIDYVGFCKIIIAKNKLVCPSLNGKFTIDDEKSVIGYKYNRKEGELMYLLYVESLDSFLALYEAGILTVWKMGLKVCELEVAGTPMVLAFCEKTFEGVIGTSEDKIIKFMYDSDSIVKVKEALLTNPGVSSIDIDKNGKLCVVGCWDGRIRYFSMKTMNLLAVLDGHGESVQCVMFCNNKLSQWGNGVVCSGGADGRVSLWNLYSDKLGESTK